MQSSAQFSSNNTNVLYPASYSDTGYLQMALGAYLTPSTSGYKSVDPYFLSQGNAFRWHTKKITVVQSKPYTSDRCIKYSFTISIGLFSGANFFPGSGCSVPADIALGIGMGVNALRHCRRRKARTVFSDPQLTGLEKRFEAQRYRAFLETNRILNIAR